MLLRRPRLRRSAGSDAARPAVRYGRFYAVCEECGRVEPFEDPGVEAALRAARARVPLRGAEWDVTVCGLCDRCSA